MRAVFGTAVIAHVEPHCRNVADEDGVRNLTRAMVATTWAVIGIVMYGHHLLLHARLLAVWSHT